MDIYLINPNGYNKKVNSIISKKLRQMRNERELTQHQVADIIGVEVITYGRYERGERVPTADKLSKLADVFICTTDYLLGKTDEPNLIHYELGKIEGMQLAIDIVEDAIKDGLTPEEIKIIVQMAKDLKRAEKE